MIFRALLDIITHRLMRSWYDAEREKARRENVAVFERVRVIHTPNLRTATLATVELMFWLSVFVLLPLYLLGTGDMRVIAVVFFVLLTPLFFISFLTRNPHHRMRRLTHQEDAFDRAADNERLYVLESGLFGIVSYDWSRFTGLWVEDTHVTLKMRTVMRELTFRFNTPDEAQRFADVSKRFVQ